VFLDAADCCCLAAAAATDAAGGAVEGGKGASLKLSLPTLLLPLPVLPMLSRDERTDDDKGMEELLPAVSIEPRLLLLKIRKSSSLLSLLPDRIKGS